MNAVVIEPLDPNEEAFAHRVAAHGNQSLAYREVFNIPTTTNPATIWSRASTYANQPMVAARIRELNRIKCDGILMSARELVQDWVDIATADPNDLVRHIIQCCRYCHGVSHRYQWRDMQEWIDACALAALSVPPTLPPEMDGGFGFTAHMQPSDTCPMCYGRGVGTTVIADTTRLTGKARKLYKGMRQKGNGDIEILMHDQEAARQALGKAMGLLGGEPPPLEPAKDDGRTIDAEASATDAAHAYLQMVR